MSVFKVERNKNYTTMSNYHLRDKTLSFKAKGLLSFMLSLPDNWDYSMNGLVSVSKESLKAIRTILQELEEHKYLIRTRYQNNKGQFQYDYSIYELPYTQYQHTVMANTDKEQQINTNIININKNDKIDKTHNSITNELIRRKFIDINDLDIYRYDELFKELLNEYEYKEIIIATNYIINKWKLNNGLDESEEIIANKFSYFKAAIINNLVILNSDIELDWSV